MSSFLRYLIAVAACIVLLGLSSPLVAGEPTVNEHIITATNDFGFRLYCELARKQGDKNLMISPVSISLALAMTYNGAQGSTQRDMAKTLGWQSLSLDEVNRGYMAFAFAMQSADRKVNITLANSLWVQQKLDINPDFFKRLKEHFDARATLVDFTERKTVDAVNRWVKDRTRGQIPEIAQASDFNRDTVLALLNATYFKGKWKTPFDKKLTRNLTFIQPDGKTKIVPMMFQERKFSYYSDIDAMRALAKPGETAPKADGVQVVSLPYGSGRLNLIIVLPGHDSSLAELQKTLTAETWHRWMSSLKEKKGTLLLPRFSMNYTAELPDALTAMGMGMAFDIDRADFRGITDLQMCISVLRHKTKMTVDETGTIAAAATKVVMTKGIDLDSFSMVVNRPFLLAIRDSSTGALLFLGSVANPE